MRLLLTLINLLFFIFTSFSQIPKINEYPFYSIDVVQNSASIVWKTKELTHGFVVFSPKKNGIENKIEEDNGFRTSHKITIEKLKPCSEYSYYILAVSENGDQFFSNVRESFTTSGCEGYGEIPGDIKEAVMNNISENTYVLEWTKSISKNLGGYIIWGFNEEGLFTIINRVGPEVYDYKFEVHPDDYETKFRLDNYEFYIQPFDDFGNFGHSKLASYKTYNSCQNLSTESNKFSYQLNPTGDPIGGGNCYRNIIHRYKANFVVTNKNEFLDAISKSKENDIIYISELDTIDLTGLKNIIIPKGVTIASNRGENGSIGGMIKYDSFWPELTYTALFVTGGENIRITGLRIQGPNPEIWDHDYSRLYSNAIKTLHKGIEVDNNEAWAWDKWFLWLAICDKAYVHHNYIHHTQRAGYGYPVWVGGSGSETNGYAKIYANIFEAARHCIASSGHRNSWEGRYNVVLNQQLYVNFDRHTSGNGLIGGKTTILSNNLILSKQDRNVGFAFPDTSVGGRVLISNNYFKNPSNNSGGCGTLYDLKDTVFYGGTVQFKNNKFGLQNARIPVAKITLDVDEGIAPLTIHFNGDGSYDTDDNSIVEYTWRFADGDYRGNEIRSKNGSYTFNEPGMYTITLFVKNSYGIPSEIVKKTVMVTPPKGKYVLSCWIKDSYPYNKSERYKKQILIDNKVIWEDDVAYDKGWQHIVKDISEFGDSKSQHRIAFRLFSKNGVLSIGDDISEIFMWVDDIWVFGSSETLENSNYSLENLKIYPPFNQTFNYPAGYKSGISTANTTEDYRGGEKSFRIRFAFGGTYLPGQWGELYKYFMFK